MKNKVLLLNLSTKEMKEYPWTESDKNQYFGGKFMGVKIISDFPDDDNLIVISTGLLNLSDINASNRYHITTVSPIDQSILSVSGSGDFGIYLKQCGVDALIIKGKAKNPLLLNITNNEIRFKEADSLWGLTVTKTQNYFHDGSHLVIGPAGENRSLLSGVYNKERRFEKGGIGAVFGNKLLKGIYVSGKPSIRSNQKSIHYPGCITCNLHCKHIVGYQELVLKSYEVRLIQLLSEKYQITFESFMMLKRTAFDLGLDFISILEYMKNQRNVKTMDDINELMYQIKENQIKINVNYDNHSINEDDALKDGISSLGCCLLASDELDHYLKHLSLTKEAFLSQCDENAQLEINYNLKRQKENI